MALKIKQDGKVKDLIIPACGVQILDMEDNFESSNLEEVLQEIGEGESIYISDEEPDKDGIWISSDNTNKAGENPTLVALKGYLDEKLGTVELITEDKTIKGAINEHETQINNNTAQLKDLANPNLLINSYFINPINQRGSTTYNEWGKYTIDRWINRAKSVEIQSDGILITMDAQYGSFVQIFEDVSIFKNKTVTLSGELEVIKGSVYSELHDGNNINCYKSFEVGSYTFSVTSKLSDNITKVQLGITNRNTGESKVKLKWLKLELGSVATPFVPRSYGEELALCQRYYQRYWRDETYKNSKMMIGMCHEVIANGYTKANFFLPVEMRVAPTVKIVGSPLQLRQSSHGGAVGGTTTFEIEPTTLNLLSIKAINAGITANTLYAIGTWATGKSNYLEADAEIY